MHTHVVFRSRDHDRYTVPKLTIPPDTHAQRWPRDCGESWRSSALVLFLDGLDVSMVGVALPSIGTELGLSTSACSGSSTATSSGYGGLLLLGGRTADLLGRRSVFLVALGVFAVASLVGGLVDNGTLLIVTRFVKGLAAAFTAPTAPVDPHHHLHTRAPPATGHCPSSRSSAPAATAPG